MPKIIAISGEIGWDVWPDEIRQQIAQAKGEDIEFQISSPGGYIYDGLEIFNMIKNYDGATTTYAVGMAASMASYILMAGDTVKAASNAIFMIHNARAYTGGDQNTHRKLANILEGMSNMLGQEYIAQTGKEKDEIATLMNEETYLFGNEIIEAGFVDEIVNIDADKVEARDDVVLNAMVKVEAMTEKLKEKPEDFGKIAALLPQETEPVEYSAKRPSAETDNPNGDKKMNLDQFLVENAAEKIVYDQRLKDAKAEGKTEGIADKQAEIDRIHPLIAAEGASTALIESGFKALKGESSVDSFVAIADYETRVNEKAKSEAAAEESDEHGDTEAGRQKPVLKNGTICSDEDAKIERELFAKMKGKEVA